MTTWMKDFWLIFYNFDLFLGILSLAPFSAPVTVWLLCFVWKFCSSSRSTSNLNCQIWDNLNIYIFIYSDSQLSPSKPTVSLNLTHKLSSGRHSQKKYCEFPPSTSNFHLNIMWRVFSWIDVFGRPVIIRMLYKRSRGYIILLRSTI